MKKIGIDIGSSTIKLVLINDGILKKTMVVHHYGKISDTIVSVLQQTEAEEAAVAIMGQQARGLTSFMEYKEEVPCIVEGLKFAGITKGSIIEIGAQSSKFITGIDKSAPEFSGNEHCAGGTGSFFEDQMHRLGLRIEDYSEMIKDAASIPRLSGRCSVFAKTDIIHRQQEGVSVPDILRGLCYAMIRNFKATIVQNANVEKPLYLCGGVSKNAGVREAIIDLFKLKKEELIVHKYALCFGAIGAALNAKKVHKTDEIIERIKEQNLSICTHVLEKLPESPDIYTRDPEKQKMLSDSKPVLGIDIGSTSTDLVLMGESGQLYDYLYLRTKGDPESAVKTGLDIFRERYGQLSFAAVGVTGSGRERIGRIIGADCIKDEITAQAKCASVFTKGVDTVFEIGGQDSKYISLKNGSVVDFQMNKICAAGTGSFVEEQAIRLHIPMEQYGKLAVAAENPVDLGERCTVFMETSISSALSEGVPKEDIAAGLCHSIIKNYLYKVVNNKPVGNYIVLQGGVCYNPGIVAAFKAVYGDRIHVSPYFSISGAVGAALLAKEENKSGYSKFHGFVEAENGVEEQLSDEILKNIAFYNKPKEIFFDDYDDTIDPEKKTVGIPFVLMMHKFFPLANAFFKRLGFNVVLSDMTNEKIILKAQEKAQGETCYPVKLIYGHFQQLIEKGVDYIFMPRIHTLKHEVSMLEHNYACSYMQEAPAMIARAMELEKKGITLLSPVFDLDFGQKAMAASMIGLGKILNRSVPLCMKALLDGAQIIRKYDKAIEAQGRTLLENIRPDEKVLVIITRTYGINDDVLNMDIPMMLLKKGYKVITLSHLPAHDLDISKDHPNLYWPFGQHIISGAKIVAGSPNLYAVYLTSHGCGPDTMLSHLFREEMGDKPYLQVEVDEHFSKVGVITRIEAFLNSLDAIENRSLPSETKSTVITQQIFVTDHMDKSDRILIPNFGIYSEYLHRYFTKLGYAAEIVKINRGRNLELGRSVTDSKEYYPFTALADEVLGSEQKGIYLVPSTKGAEADGQYAYALSAILKREGITGKRIFAPVLEDIPERTTDFDALFRAIVAADLNTNGYGSSDDFSEIPEWDELDEIACKEISDRRATIGLVGEPWVLSSLAKPQEEKIAENFHIVKAGIADYLLFLWIKQGGKGRRIAAVKKQLGRIRSILGNNGIYSDMDQLRDTAERTGLSLCDAGNIAYRFSKAVDMSIHCKGVIQMAPRYENISIIMENLKLKNYCMSPYYHLALDGDFDEASERKLDSFLYYV